MFENLCSAKCVVICIMYILMSMCFVLQMLCIAYFSSLIDTVFCTEGCTVNIVHNILCSEHYMVYCSFDRCALKDVVWPQVYICHYLC